MSILLNHDIEWQNYHTELNLNNDHVHIFKFQVDKVYEKIAPFYKEVLSENELIKVNRYLHIEDKKSAVVSKYMQRNILSKFSCILPSLIQFHLSNNKKPSFKGGIEFNTSHSKNIVLIAISKNPVGVDIEFVNKDFDYQTIIPAVCDDLEQSFINLGLDSLISFYSLWTRKEAILKVTGEGLLDNLRDLNCLKNTIYRNQTKYCLSSLIVEHEYIASLAYCCGTKVVFWDY